MKMHDLNPERERIILLLHPMLATAEMMEKLVAEPLGGEYRYLIPDFGGHGEAADQPYESAAKEAEAIRAWLKDRQIPELELAYGASLGGVVLMDLLAGPMPAAKKLFFEGASFYENAGLMASVIKSVMGAKLKKAKAQPERAVTKLSSIYGKEAGPIMAKQMLGLSQRALEHIVDDCGHVRLPRLTAEQQKNTVFAYGEKDGDLKDAQRLQPRRYPGARLVVWKGCGHCTHITEDPAAYGVMLRKFLTEGVI